MHLDLHVWVPYFLEAAFGVIADFVFSDLLLFLFVVCEAYRVYHVNQRKCDLFHVFGIYMVYVLHLAIWILFLILALFIIEFLCLLPAAHAVHCKWEKLPIPDIFLKDKELTV